MKARINQFALPILCVMVFTILWIDYQFIFLRIHRRNQFAKNTVQMAEANRETIFKVSKIVKYSSAEASDNTAEQNLQDLNIHQYSDIAIFIDNGEGELTEKNTIKELYVDQFKVEVAYPNGTQSLYYKNPLEISKFRMNEEKKIQDSLQYDIVYTNEENETKDYETPTFFADCSNPITIGYINKNVVEHYQVTKENGMVSFDGRMLKNLDIDLKKLSPRISFTIHLKNNLDENFICHMSVKMPLETEEGGVTSGYIIQIADKIGEYRFFKEV